MAEEDAAGPTAPVAAGDRDGDGPPPPHLRVASLLPSATDICIALGLADRVVGVTHECDWEAHPLFPPAGPASLWSADGSADGSSTTTAGLPRPPSLTVSGIDPALRSQAEIDAAVGASATGEGPSLCRLDGPALAAAAPTVVLTQGLCGVCAVGADEAERGVRAAGPGGDGCRVVSLEPRTLDEVAETFVAVAESCGVRERGTRLAEAFRGDVRRVSDIVAAAAVSRPRVLYLEWLDPPFDAGHWVSPPSELARLSLARRSVNSRLVH